MTHRPFLVVGPVDTNLTPTDAKLESATTGSESMPSALAAFFAEVFPELVPEARPQPGCWVSKMLALDPAAQAFVHMSTAVGEVARFKQLDALADRMRNEHPRGKPCRPSYDQNVLACITEACAFAWAALSVPGTPTLISNVAGTPDVRVDSGPDITWVEGKHIRRSDDDLAAIKASIGSGELLTGLIMPPPSGFYRKFDFHLDNALKKFKRSPDGRRIVFMNLAELDMASSFLREEVSDELSRWVSIRESADSALTIVVCFMYNWERPDIGPAIPL